MVKLGKRTGYKCNGQTVSVSFERGEARLEIVSPEIVRVFFGAEDDGERSWAVAKRPLTETDFTVKDGEDGLVISTDAVRVRVDDDFYVDIFDAEGNSICMDYRGDRRPVERVSKEYIKLLSGEGHAVYGDNPYEIRELEAVKCLDPDVHFYGLGDKTGFLDKRHYDYMMWNTDDPDPQVDCFKALYKTIPFFIALSDRYVYGIFFDNTYKSFFNMGQEAEEYYYFNAVGGNLDYYYIAGSSIADVLRSYTALTGRYPLPQRWTLGYHQSRWGYITQGDVAYIADGMRTNGIPCDSIHLDIDYMEGYRVFTWNRGRYHDDPESFLKGLAEKGFKPVTIIDPGVKKDEGYYVYDEGIEKGYFALSPSGEVYENAVWPGDAVYPDFGKEQTRSWWAGLHKFLADKGVRGVWNDMNEPASFKGPLPDDVVFSEEDKPSSHAKIHNVYGHLMAKAAYEGMKQADGRRPFVITRACYAGTQNYSTVWTGDNHSIWAHLQMAIPQLCNLGLSGIPFAGTDVGGFGSDTTAELLLRWVQVGCFSPLFRNHSALGSRVQEPWRFDDKTLDIYRKYVKLRYRLIPYFYDLFYEEEQTGAPIIRPLVFHYEKDENARVCNDEFLVGDRILVAPVVTQGSLRRMVYLPEGEWYDYWTREKISGPAWFIREAPIDVCPIYVKAGSALPMMTEQEYVGEKDEDVLLLDIFPGKGTWDHYLDNGEDFAYREGCYHQYRIQVYEDGTWESRVIHAGYGKPYQTIQQAVSIPGVRQAR